MPYDHAPHHDDQEALLELQNRKHQERLKHDKKTFSSSNAASSFSGHKVCKERLRGKGCEVEFKSKCKSHKSKCKSHKSKCKSHKSKCCCKKPECPVSPNPGDLPALNAATAFDQATIVENILVWPDPVIPAFSGDPEVPYFNKFQSVNYSLGFYFDVDMFTVQPYDENLSVFLTNLEDRGYDAKGGNYKKRAYMWALNCENTKNYSARINNFLNAWYSDITVARKPLLSSFETQVILFFLNVHIGDDTYPDWLIRYFQAFINIIGFADPDRPGRDDEMLWGHANTDCVRKYFRDRRQIILDNHITDTIVYGWAVAGVPEQNLVMEAIHNMVAFSQFNNTMYKIVQNQLNPPPGRPSYFVKFKEATGNPQEQLNVIREIFRLEVPNQVSFSRKGGTLNTQTRHVHQAIMVANEGGIVPYGTYNTARYAAFNTSFDDCLPPPPPPGPGLIRKPADEFTLSPVDAATGFGTELPNDNLNMIPVFDPPIYTPFGLGYRRCAGEVFTYSVILKLIDRICDLTFVQDAAIIEPLIPLAPFFAVPDNLFVEQPVL
jgi:hypothetical protein